MRNLLLPTCLLLIVMASCGQKSSSKKEKQPIDTASYNAMVPSKATGWVSDFEQVLTADQVSYLDKIISDFESQTTNEISIVTLVLDTTKIKTDQDLADFTRYLFNKWGVGKKEKNNGVGILFSKTSRSIQIVVGEGVRHQLTDNEARGIVDTVMTPEFKQGGYYVGLEKGLQAVIRELK